MPSKCDKFVINNEVLDKRVKLLQSDKEAIKMEYSKGASIRGLSREYNVSKRTIQFILFPERLVTNKHHREQRGGSRLYYDKDKHAKAMSDHRQYKNFLMQEGLI